jgi:hypothetical protein
LDVFVDELGRLAARPAPTQETARAKELGSVLRDLRPNPQKAVAAVEESVKGVEAATGFVEKLVELARDLANLTDPAIAAKRAEELVARILEDHREGRFRDVVVLVGAVLNIYLLAERWRTLVGLLQLDLLSAEELGDSAEALAAQHDLDVIAEACGLTPTSGESPDEAHEPAEPAAEHVTGAATGQAGGVALGVKVAGAVAGAVLVAGAVVGVTVAVRDEPDSVPDPGTGRAEIIAFAARHDHAAPASDQDPSAEVPGGAVDPGDTLEACRPLYLDTYVVVGGVEQETTLALTSTIDGEAFAPYSAPWARSEPLTTAVWWFVGLGERASEPLPYGRWEVVVQVGDREVDRGEVVLEEVADPIRPPDEVAQEHDLS